MVISYLKKFGEAKREDIDKLLLDKISDAWMKSKKETGSGTYCSRCHTKTTLSSPPGPEEQQYGCCVSS